MDVHAFLARGMQIRLQVRQAITSPAKGRVAHRDYQPTYRESGYQRPVFLRLTPLARFVLALAAIAVAAGGALLVSRAFESNGTLLLTERLNTRPTSVAESIIVQILVTPEAISAAVDEPSANAEAAPAAAPTADWSRAPWAGKLVKQPDGTLAAPQPVIAKAVDDLSAYYAIQRDLPLDDYLARREEILTTYFTGAALDEMRRLEESRDVYAMNRVGRFSMEVRNFSPDGLSAKAGVITRDWVSDVYDVESRQLMAQGRAKKDTLTIMTILFDPSGERWKFAAVEEITELNQ